MKRITIALMLIVGVFLTGCTKNYSPITYTKFVESFNGKENYVVKDKSKDYEEEYTRCFISSKKDVLFTYYEFETEEKAKDYVVKNYDNRKNYKLKDKKIYTTVKNTSGMYFYLVQIDKVVISGSSDSKKNKGEINKIIDEMLGD